MILPCEYHDPALLETFADYKQNCLNSLCVIYHPIQCILDRLKNIEYYKLFKIQNGIYCVKCKNSDATYFGFKIFPSQLIYGDDCSIPVLGYRTMQDLLVSARTAIWDFFYGGPNYSQFAASDFLVGKLVAVDLFNQATLQLGNLDEIEKKASKFSRKDFIYDVEVDNNRDCVVVRAQVHRNRYNSRYLFGDSFNMIIPYLYKLLWRSDPILTPFFRELSKI
jgi:hypothetical protein